MKKIEFEIENDISSIKPIKVVYSKPDYSNFFKANKDFEERNKIKVDLKSLIKLPAFFYKDPLYKIEKEIRLLHEEGSPNQILNNEENNPYKYDFNSRNKIVSYFSLPLYDDAIGCTFIKIKKIQLGFKFSEDERKDIEEHIGLIFCGISKKLGKKIEVPIIEISPLKNKYR